MRALPSLISRRALRACQRAQAAAVAQFLVYFDYLSHLCHWISPGNYVPHVRFVSRIFPLTAHCFSGLCAGVGQDPPRKFPARFRKKRLIIIRASSSGGVGCFAQTSSIAAIRLASERIGSPQNPGRRPVPCYPVLPALPAPPLPGRRCGRGFRRGVPGIRRCLPPAPLVGGAGVQPARRAREGRRQVLQQRGRHSRPKDFPV